MTTGTIDPRTIRKSPIAGKWYPGKPDELQATVDDYLARAERISTDDELIALISPHAGYPYSGQTAAHAYRQLEQHQYDAVVLLGPSHYDDFGAVAVTTKKFYWTPLGEIELDQDFITKLSRQIALTPVERDREHSLEIQIPFLQRMLLNFKLVPLMLSMPFYIVGARALETCTLLANALAELARERRVLFVASSDLSHLPDYHAVKKFDARTEELIAAFDIPGLADYAWQTGECRACGDAPIITTLLAAKALGADRVRVLHRTNSGDVTGEREHADYVVGYLAAAAYKSKK
ncbi:MAG: AmmeMemoRadiSam system protein B [Chloroflexi bacterium]|nr:AmmeMemoRadiSam system protein B [Chloroflexota bacterium]